MDEYEEDGPYSESTDEEEPIQEKQLSYESSFNEATDEEVFPLIREAFEEKEQRRRVFPIDDRCKNVVLALLGEAHDRAKGNVYSPVLDNLEQAAVKAFFHGTADYLLGGKI